MLSILLCLLAVPVALAANKTITFGGTVSYTGKYTYISSRVIAGQELWRQLVNDQGGIVVGNDRYFVEFYFEDNESSGTVIETVLPQMLNSSIAECVTATCYRTSNASFTPDFVLSPYGTVLTKPTALITEAHGMLLVAGTAATTSVYTGKKLMYGTSAASEGWVSGILKTLALRGAKTFAYGNMDLGLTKGTCQFVPVVLEDLRERLGLEAHLVLGGYGSDDLVGHLSASPTTEEIWELVRKLVEADPDVFFGCFYYEHCIEFMRASEELGFNPKAHIHTICASDPRFATDLGENSRYVIGPTPWDPELRIEPGIQGMTPKDWVEFYKVGTNTTDPVPFQVAGHYTTLTVMKAAIEASQSLNQHDVAYALSRLDIDTMFGRITFDANGQARTPIVYVQRDAQDNYDIVLPEDSATSSLIYPSPTYEQRTCVAERGPDSCVCSMEGCPTCTSEFWGYTETECFANQTKLVHHYWLSNDTQCQNGESLPGTLTVACSYVVANSGFGGVTIAFAIVFASLNAVLLVLVTVFRSRPVLKMAQFSFSFITILGAVLDVTGTAFQVDQNTDVICNVRRWFAHVPFVMLFSGLAVKMFRVWTITVANKSLKRARKDASVPLLQVFGMVFVSVLILIVGTFADPVVAKDVPHVVGTTVVSNVVCTAETGTFDTISSMYKLGLIVGGLYLCFSLRKLSSSLAETKPIAIATYNIAMWWVTEQLISSMTSSPTTLIILYVMNHVIGTTLAMAIIFVPKFQLLNATASELLNSSSSGGGAHTHRPVATSRRSIVPATTGTTGTALTNGSNPAGSKRYMVVGSESEEIAQLRAQVADLKRQLKQAASGEKAAAAKPITPVAANQPLQPPNKPPTALAPIQTSGAAVPESEKLTDSTNVAMLPPIN